MPISSDLLYVANAGSNSITVYHHDASGDTAPIKIIAGSKTKITSPGQLSEDAAGNLYVANNNYAHNPIVSNILVFAHGANGNVEPIRNLLVPYNGVSQGDQAFVSGMTVDQITGKIIVARAEIAYGTYLTLLRFPPDATRSEAPYAISAIFYYHDTPQIATDSTGDHVLLPQNVANPCDCQGNSGVNTDAEQFPNEANAYLYGLYLPCPANLESPDVCYGPSSVSGVADDPTTKTYLVSTLAESGTGGILRFPESARSYKPASTITSATNCSALALGYLRNIYAMCGTNTIDVYEHDAFGAAKPIRVLSGPATKLDNPVGIYEGK